VFLGLLWELTTRRGVGLTAMSKPPIISQRLSKNHADGKPSQQTGALVAIKSVNLSKLNKKLKENLYSEIDILKGLQHPHIVALIDCTESTTHIHLVMEFCELGDLSFFIKRRDKFLTNPATAEMTRKYPNPAVGGLNEVITRHFLKQLASALEFLRVRNFIHRDVKPQNLLLNPSIKYLRNNPDNPLIMSVTENSNIPHSGIESLPMLKIADFGFARSLPATSLAETLCGSPLYMAPEILRYEKYDAKADLWSVGTVLYEMVVGKAPFRASNHVELLRKIEQGDDVIKFPKDTEVSPAMKAVIRGLLKRNPVERISFENFFAHEVIKAQIPGLVGEDKPRESRKPPAKIEDTQPMRRPSQRDRNQAGDRRSISTTETPQHPSSQVEQAQRNTRPSSRDDQRPFVSRPVSGTPPRSVGEGRTGGSLPSGPSQNQKRPVVQASSTAPNMEYIQKTRGPAPGPVEMMRRVSQDSPSPGSSLMKDPMIIQGNQPRKDDRAKRDERERAAQDVMFERDYVVVEKRAVEVNAFADEMAANPRISGANHVQSPPSRAGPIVRRATTQGAPTSATGAVPSQPSRAVQIAQGKQRPDHQRQNSYERRYGPSPSSTTSAISKAIAGASLRLFGIGFTPTGLKGQSPPLHNPFPVYPASPGIAGLIADGKIGTTLDEDAKAVHIIEESATRSDVVYGFAEVKYKQLIPLAPSMDHGLGGPISREKGDPFDEDDEEGLTPDAVVVLSEEALVLYVKSLSLLAKSMDIASAWWARKGRGEVIGSSNSPRGNSPSVIAAGNRVNSAVQWVRTRFNEVLEKAEFVRLKLIEAQNKLPEDHPAHPSNHYSLGGASSIADGVYLSSDVNAEKLMYDRAVEMSRAAAINEIANSDLSGCEISYVTAIRMLEAVLEDDDTPQKKGGSSKEEKENRADNTADGALDGADREVVTRSKWIVSSKKK